MIKIVFDIACRGDYSASVIYWPILYIS